MEYEVTDTSIIVCNSIVFPVKLIPLFLPSFEAYRFKPIDKLKYKPRPSIPHGVDGGLGGHLLI